MNRTFINIQKSNYNIYQIYKITSLEKQVCNVEKKHLWHIKNKSITHNKDHDYKTSNKAL